MVLVVIVETVTLNTVFLVRLFFIIDILATVTVIYFT